MYKKWQVKTHSFTVADRWAADVRVIEILGNSPDQKWVCIRHKTERKVWKVAFKSLQLASLRQLQLTWTKPKVKVNSNYSVHPCGHNPRPCHWSVCSVTTWLNKLSRGGGRIQQWLLGIHMAPQQQRWRQWNSGVPLTSSQSPATIQSYSWLSVNTPNPYIFGSMSSLCKKCILHMFH